MPRHALVISAFTISLVFIGCGPLQVPMVARLEDKAQKKIDESWEKALNPVDQLDHQTLLDLFVVTNAYQVGVDKVYFRSEKRYSKGLVVMEVHFDRAVPTEDRFEVKVFDERGKVVRQERYNRDDVKKTCDDLFERIPQANEGQRDPPEIAEKRAKLEARLAKIEAYFPKDKDENEKGEIGKGKKNN